MEKAKRIPLLNFDTGEEYYIDSQEIKVKYFDTSAPELEFIDNKSDWVDLRAAADMEIKKGEQTLIPLGVAMKLPSGYEAHVAPRSSTFKNWGLIQTNSVGVIDESYCGDKDEWKMPVYATRDTSIKKGDRVCQFRIVEKQPKLIFKKVNHLKGENRGGFGSTGVN